MMKASQLRHRFPLEGMTSQKGESRVNQMHSLILRLGGVNEKLQQLTRERGEGPTEL